MNYAGNIRYAWMVVEKKLLLDGYALYQEGGKWHVGLIGQDGIEESVGSGVTAAEAICRAALNDAKYHGS